MTGVDDIVIGNFESKLNRLMEAYTQLSVENTALREQLAQQSVELTKVREQYDELTASYASLKLAKIISVGDSEIGSTRQRLLGLVREVDRCIALLNASAQKEDTL